MNHPDSSLVEQGMRNPQGLAELPRRDGKTYNHTRDGARLHKQHNRVLAIIQDGQWHTLAEIALHTRDPEASISARLRDLRKPQFGGHRIDREYVERGLFRYRLVSQAELFA